MDYKKQNLSQSFIKNIEESNDDHIYYNMVLTNNTNKYIPATFQQSRTDSILQNPNEYYLSIIRFLIPTGSIPIFEFKDNTYSVSLSYYSEEKDVTYVQQTFVVYDPNLIAYDSSRGIYSYNVFIDMINKAFSDCLEALNIQLVTAGVVRKTFVSPFMKFDPLTKLITLYAEISGYLESANPNSYVVEVWMNTALQSFFPSFELFYNGSDTSVNPDATFGRNFFFILHSNSFNIEADIPYPYFDLHVSNQAPNENDHIDFKEGSGSQLTGSIFVNSDPMIHERIFKNMSDLCLAIQIAMNAAPGATYKYQVEWDYTDHKVIVYSYNGAFTLLFGTGTNKATSIAPFIGFKDLDVTSSQGLGVNNIATADTETGVFDSISSVQEYNTMFAWNSLRSITFTTTTIPIQHEYLPGANPTLGLQLFSSILTDFQVDVSEAPEARSFVQYVPQSEYRLVSLGGTTPLRTLDMNLSWVDNLQASHQIYIPPYQSMSSKILFRRKAFNGISKHINY